MSNCELVGVCVYTCSPNTWDDAWDIFSHDFGDPQKCVIRAGNRTGYFLFRLTTEPSLQQGPSRLTSRIAKKFFFIKNFNRQSFLKPRNKKFPPKFFLKDSFFWIFKWHSNLGLLIFFIYFWNWTFFNKNRFTLDLWSQSASYKERLFPESLFLPKVLVGRGTMLWYNSCWLIHKLD